MRRQAARRGCGEEAATQMAHACLRWQHLAARRHDSFRLRVWVHKDHLSSLAPCQPSSSAAAAPRRLLPSTRPIHTRARPSLALQHLLHLFRFVYIESVANLEQHFFCCVLKLNPVCTNEPIHP